MDDLSVTDIEGNMVDRLSACIEQQITRLDLIEGDLLAVCRLVS